jgi:hypothetical protein
MPTPANGGGTSSPKIRRGECARKLRVRIPINEFFTNLLTWIIHKLSIEK